MNAAFRSSHTNEAYIFMQDECVTGICTKGDI
ncbi:hypothetical protein CsSME_00005219 [Camellia sinensis var. sinensis]